MINLINLNPGYYILSCILYFFCILSVLDYISACISNWSWQILVWIYSHSSNYLCLGFGIICLDPSYLLWYDVSNADSSTSECQILNFCIILRQLLPVKTALKICFLYC